MTDKVDFIGQGIYNKIKLILSENTRKCEIFKKKDKLNTD